MFNYKLNGIIVAALLGKKFNDQSGLILNALIFGYELTYESEYQNLQLLSDNIFVCIKDKTEHTAKRWQDFFGKITQLDRNVFEDTSSYFEHDFWIAKQSTLQSRQNFFFEFISFQESDPVVAALNERHRQFNTTSDHMFCVRVQQLILFI